MSQNLLATPVPSVFRQHHHPHHLGTHQSLQSIMDLMDSDDEISHDSLFDEEVDDDNSSQSSGPYHDTDLDTDIEYDDEALELVTEYEFDNPSDALDFRGISQYHYTQEVMPLKHVYLRKTSFRYYFDDMLEDRGRKRLGDLIARNIHLRAVCFRFQSSNPQYIPLLFRGPFQQHNLKTFKIEVDPMRTTRRNRLLNLPREHWVRICNYLENAPGLKYLALRDMQLDIDRASLIVTALRGAKLKDLEIQNVHICDTALGFLLSSLDTSQLRQLVINNCPISTNTSHVLADLFANSTTLESIDFDESTLNDDCIRILCSSLHDNTTLKYITIYGNEDITMVGWECLEKVVGDSSSLESLYASNHTIETILGHPQFSLPDGDESSDDFGREPQTDLDHLLAINTQSWYRMDDTFHRNEDPARNKKLRARMKVVRRLSSNNGRLSMDAINEFDVELMPRILAFAGRATPDYLNPESVGEQTDVSAFMGLDGMYQVVRQWKMPTLFNFPSAEKVRHASQTKELEKKNKVLYAKNVEQAKEIERLKAQVDKLSSENELLVSENKHLRVEREHDAKRQRKG